MSTDPDTILLEAEEHMTKSIEHLTSEFRGLRTGRASPSIVEYLKVDYYGSPTDLKALASISVAEASQLLIKPFDVGAMAEIKKAIESSDLGLNPMVDGKQIRVNLPALSGDRRKQLVAHCKRVGEESKVSIRNIRRDANKHSDALGKQDGANFPEDEIKTLKTEVQDLLKKYESKIDALIDAKVKEIEEV